MARPMSALATSAARWTGVAAVVGVDARRAIILAPPTEIPAEASIRVGGVGGRQS
jgi:hypothetical protein